MNETISPSPAKTGMQLGILFGVIMVLEFVIGYVLNIDPVSNPNYGWIINILNYLILPLLLIYLACNTYKKNNGGFISFGACLKIGVTLCLIAGAIYAIFFTVFNMMFPEFMEDMLRKTQQVMLEKNPDMAADQVDMAMSMSKKFMQPAIMLPVTIVMFTLIGLIHSLIIGAIVKKDRPVSF